MAMQFNEPWHECDEGKCGCGQILGPESTYITSVAKPDVRRRIVACVNFCAGISTENLEGNEKLLWLAEQYNAVKSQREALQAVIGELLDRGLFFSSAIESGDDDIDFKDWESRARAAIAKDKGGDA